MGTNLKDLETKFAKAKNELKVFEKLDSGEKIMKEQTTNILYSDPPDNFQFIRRWWAGENWKKTIEHLDEVFGSFTKFLDQILKFAQINGLGPVYKFINRVFDENYEILKKQNAPFLDLEDTLDTIKNKPEDNEIIYIKKSNIKLKIN